MDATESRLWRTWRTEADTSAFSDLVRPHLEFAVDLARRAGCQPSDADDVVQRCLIRLSQETRDTPERVGLRSWLGRNVISEARMTFRARRRRAAHETASARDGDAAPGSLAAQDEVTAALASLDPEARRLVELRFLYDLEYREVAFIVGSTPLACRLRVHRALRRLRRRLGPTAALAVAGLPRLEGARATTETLEGAVAEIGRWSPAASVPATAVGGVVLVGTWGRVGLAAAVVVVAVASWMVLGRNGPDTHVSANGGAAVELANSGLAAPPAAIAARTGATNSTAGTDAGASSARAAGWRLVGIVRGAEGRPVPAAEILMTLSIGDDLVALPGAVTDDDGAYAAQIDDPPDFTALEASLATLRVTVAASGHLPSTKNLDAPGSAGDREVHHDVVLATGWTVRGRVRDIRGQPVPWARVTLCAGTNAPMPHTTTDVDGRYRLPVERSGPHRIVARQDRFGTGAVALPLVVGRDAWAEDLVVRGEGVLAGRVVHPDGSPAPFLPVEARSPGTSAETEVACDAETPGLASASILTDAQGRFRFEGLRQGSYEVAPCDGPPAEEEPPRDRHATGEEDVVVVCDHGRLMIRVRDQDGHPVRGAYIKYKARAKDFESTGMTMARGPEAAVFDRVVPGMRVRATATAGDLFAGPSDFTVPDGAWESELVLVVANRRSPGRLRVVVDGPQGEVVSRFRAHLTPIRKGSGIEATESFGEADAGRSPPLVPGRYEVEVWPGRTDDAPGVQRFQTVAREIDVTAGKETLVRIQARVGGHLRLTVRPSRPTAERGLTLAARLRPSAGGEETQLAPHHGGEARDPTLPYGTWPVGVPTTHEVALAPGRYVLVVGGSGWRTFERVVDVEAGAVADVEVVLEAE
jgi:RNA polymerase sigma factor (sigma-70 family)